MEPEPGKKEREKQKLDVQPKSTHDDTAVGRPYRERDTVMLGPLADPIPSPVPRYVRGWVEVVHLLRLRA